jgi:phage gpG-like protein
MSNRILPKHSDTAGVQPSASQLVAYELAINTADGKAYAKRPNGQVVEIGGAGRYLTTESVMQNDITIESGTSAAMVGTVKTNGNLLRVKPSGYLRIL